MLSRYNMPFLLLMLICKCPPTFYNTKSSSGALIPFLKPLFNGAILLLTWQPGSILIP
jgi:hypothetical protein